jgi:hypothetical protein
MKKISELFDVRYGVNLELNALTECDITNKNAVKFVSRTSKNNGVSAIVEKIAGKEPIPAGNLTVAGGGSVLETFLQPQPFYSGRDLYILFPLVEMTDIQKLYYCVCIRANKYRYNYGRQANRTLKNILVPNIDEIPSEISNTQIVNYSNLNSSISNEKITPDTSEWKAFRYDELFDIKRGKGPRIQDLNVGLTPFVTSIDSKNGVTAFTDYIPCHKGNTIGVNRNGSVGEAFYHENPFCSTEDVHIFNSKFKLNKYTAMFLITLIKKERYRFNYGRKWGINRMKQSIIKLPTIKNGTPDFDYMESYIKSLPFSASI